MNDEGEVDSYTQTYLEDIQELSNPEKIIQPLKAIEVLFYKREIPSNSKITDPELGLLYICRSLDTTQVLKIQQGVLLLRGKEGCIVVLLKGKLSSRKLNRLQKEKVTEEEFGFNFSVLQAGVQEMPFS